MTTSLCRYSTRLRATAVPRLGAKTSIHWPQNMDGAASQLQLKQNSDAEGPESEMSYVQTNLPPASMDPLTETKVFTLNTIENDEVGIFAAMLATRLRRLHPQVSATLRNQIHNLVSLAEDEQYQIKIEGSSSVVKAEPIESHQLNDETDDPLPHIIKIEQDADEEMLCDVSEHSTSF